MRERDGSDSEGRPTKRARADTSAHVPPAANYEKVLLSIRNEYFDAMSRDYAQHWRLPNEILILDHICSLNRVGTGQGGGRKKGEYREIFSLWWRVRGGGIVNSRLNETAKREDMQNLLLIGNRCYFSLLPGACIPPERQVSVADSHWSSHHKSIGPSFASRHAGI